MMPDPAATPSLRVALKSDLDGPVFPDERNAVWVWVIPLAGPAFDEHELTDLLTDEERTRADRYKVASARLQFVAGRGLLRKMLGRQLGVSPTEVPITYSGSGKPLLANAVADLHFNVSHTDGLALIATARRPVGIDVERLRPVSEPEGLIRRFFSSRECETFLALPEDLRLAAFFRGWTSKEAVIKAVGLSVAYLNEFDVELHPGRNAALLGARHPTLVGRRWALSAWEPAPDYRAAIAFQLES